MSITDYDLAVIGAGPGGYVAAIRAAQRGRRVAIVERAELGGVCLNWGCIPTKALLRSAEAWSQMHHAREFGIAAGQLSTDLSAIVQRSRDAAGRLSRGVRNLLRKHNIEVIYGEATLLARGKLAVTQTDGRSRELSARDVILATGGRAREIAGIATDGKQVWSCRDAMTPSELPESLAIVGAGPIGVEFASFYRDLGSRVSVIERMERILPAEDEDISEFARASFEARGIEMLTSTEVTQLDRHADYSTLHYRRSNEERSLSAQRILIATGIVGNTDIGGLRSLNVGIERAHIVTDAWGDTGVEGLWAIGDVTGPPWLAHKASHEGIIAVDRMLGVPGLTPIDKENIPSCTYCRPQIASVGITEQAARNKGYSLKIGKFPAAANGKAIALGEPAGFVKTIFDADTGELLGAHMIGPEVTELIHGLVIAKALEATEKELAGCIFPHPTLSEMIPESILAAHGLGIHA